VYWPLLAPFHPALQVQLVIIVLANGEKAFKGQNSHWKFPGIDLYVPSTHFVHCPPLGLLHPALQVQFVMIVLATGE